MIPRVLACMQRPRGTRSAGAQSMVTSAMYHAFKSTAVLEYSWHTRTLKSANRGLPHSQSHSLSYDKTRLFSVGIRLSITQCHRLAFSALSQLSLAGLADAALWRVDKRDDLDRGGSGGLLLQPQQDVCIAEWRGGRCLNLGQQVLARQVVLEGEGLRAGGHVEPIRAQRETAPRRRAYTSATRTIIVIYVAAEGQRVVNLLDVVGQNLRGGRGGHPGHFRVRGEVKEPDFRSVARLNIRRRNRLNVVRITRRPEDRGAGVVEGLILRDLDDHHQRARRQRNLVNLVELRAPRAVGVFPDRDRPRPRLEYVHPTVRAARLRETAG